MERIKGNHFFCEECSLQFGNKTVFGVLLSFVNKKSQNIVHLDQHEKFVHIIKENQDLMPQNDLDKPNEQPENQLTETNQKERKKKQVLSL